MANDPKSESELIQAAVAGDRAALQGLLLAYYRQIEATIRARFSSELTAHLEVEDLVQEVLVDVHRSIGSFRGTEPGSFAAWLQRITENRIIDTVRYYRRQKRAGGSSQRIVQANPSNESLDALLEWVCADANSPYRASRIKETREMVQVCVSALKDKQRRAVIAHYFNHRDPSEIATELNCSTGAARELLRRARRNLAVLFGTASAWLSSR